MHPKTPKKLDVEAANPERVYQPNQLTPRMHSVTNQPMVFFMDSQRGSIGQSGQPAEYVGPREIKQASAMEFSPCKGLEQQDTRLN